MNGIKNRINAVMTALSDMRLFLILWLTQTFSGLGSAMTGYALVLWSYEQQGSALVTALLMVSSYAPYVLCSIFAGALSDRWDKRRTMLTCDAIAAVTTLLTLLMLRTGTLRIWHLYLLNAVLFDLIAVDLTDRICRFVLCIRFDKGEIFTVLQLGLVFIDPLCILCNQTAFLLTEDIDEPCYGNLTASDQFTEYIPCADTL